MASLATLDTGNRSAPVNDRHTITPDEAWAAFERRDRGWDGRLVGGVKTTGIYCRPVCPAKPRRENVEFFATAHLAERAGYRPCLRCRPEAAPQSPAWAGKSALVQYFIARRLHGQSVLVLRSRCHEHESIPY